nr:MAG TPA: hypothetical protein [Caudoviricetes sp.]DAT80979.1 MAG TPA: hypothetical protein [Caudoviricetes sp.]DAX89723.1 MAG TPA: hypothetical protein [Caudoviricetes sp.]
MRCSLQISKEFPAIRRNSLHSFQMQWTITYQSIQMRYLFDSLIQIRPFGFLFLSKEVQTISSSFRMSSTVPT